MGALETHISEEHKNEVIQRERVGSELRNKQVTLASRGVIEIMATGYIVYEGLQYKH